MEAAWLHVLELVHLSPYFRPRSVNARCEQGPLKASPRPEDLLDTTLNTVALLSRNCPGLPPLAVFPFPCSHQLSVSRTDPGAGI